MPRYLILREISETGQQDLPGFGLRAKRTAEKFPGVRWEHSHVVSDESGVMTFCVYESPNEEMIREHAEVLGDHRVDRVFEIAADVTPGDFAA